MSLEKSQENMEEYLQQELERLRSENASLRRDKATAYAYIRRKVDRMLGVIGTSALKPEELDDASLVEFDPIGIVADSFQHVIDNLRETNRKLHFAHNEIQTIFDTVGAALLVLNPQKQIVAYNQKTQELLLGDISDALGQECSSAICGEVSPHDCLFEKILASGCEQQFQAWSLNRHVFNVVGRPLLDDAGKISHVVMAYSDITERKAAESALRQSLAETQEANSKIEGILRSVSDCLLITDAKDRIALINSRAEDLLGFCMLGNRDEVGIDSLPSPRLRDILIGARQADEFIKEDIAFPDDSGGEYIYQARVTVIRSSEGAFRGCITFLHDVTEQRELDRLKSEFVTTAAHELQTPLATIIGYTDLLLNTGEDAGNDLDDSLTQIQQKAERLARIVDDLLDISRIESGEALQISPGPHLIADLCRDVVKNFTVLSDRHRLVLDMPEEAPIRIRADHYTFNQILENILSNAVKYSPAGGIIRLSASCDDKYGHLCVADEGIGMNPDQLERIYDKFYRANTSNTAISGTGLGMTIVKYLMEAQQGSVKVESSPNRGTVVQLRFPLAEQCCKSFDTKLSS